MVSFCPAGVPGNKDDNDPEDQSVDHDDVDGLDYTHVYWVLMAITMYVLTKVMTDPMILMTTTMLLRPRR